MAQQYKESLTLFLHKIFDDLDEKTQHSDTLLSIEVKLHIRRSYLILVVGIFTLFFVLFGFGQCALCNLIGFVYPLFQSLKALKTPEKKDDTQWLTYWEVFGFLTLIESFTDFFLYWIPMYYLVKICFLVWCFSARTKGARLIFRRVISPFLDRLSQEVAEDVTEYQDSQGKDSQGKTQDSQGTDSSPALKKGQ